MNKPKNQVLNDPTLKPYFIEKNKRGFIIKENKMPNPKNGKTVHKGVPYQKVVEYSQNFSSCLEKLIELLTKYY